MKNKKLFAILTLVCFMFTLMPVAAFAGAEDTVILKIDSKNVYKNGEVITTDVAPTIVDGRTMVPVRVIMEAMGGEVDWDADNRIVTIHIDGKVLRLVIDKEIADFGTGAIIIDGRTMVPIRYISEYAGYEVEWVESTRQVIISKMVEYTVSFDMNVNGEGVFKTVTVQEGQTVDKPEIEYKSGKVFHGWYTNDEGKGDVFDFSTPIYSDLTLYGHWSQQQYSSTPSHTHSYSTPVSNENGTHSYKCTCGEIENEYCKYEEGFCTECKYEKIDTWDGTYDTSWYNETDTEFTLTTAEQLAGLGTLVDGGNTFAGKTVKLGAGMDLYLPDGEDWFVSFDPIGDDSPFSGTFDGQNHTISNMFQSGWAFDYEWGSYGSIGLFGELKDATVKNLTISGAESYVEGGDVGGITGSASGTCVFENITIEDSSFATFNNGNGGIIGWSGAGNYTFKNITIDEDTVLAGLWGSFDSSIGGVVGQGEPGATYNFENVDIACRLDVYNDCTASYDYYNYRMCGMIIGRLEKTTTIDGTNYPDTSQYDITCNDVTVTYGDWANYHYCDPTPGYNNGRGMRVEVGYSYDGLPADYDHSQCTTHCNVLIAFDQIFGGAQYGVTGLKTYDGVTVIYNNK